MYPTCIAGGVGAIIFTSVFNENVSTSQAFTHPIAYQYFLFHSMLIILGITIIGSKEAKLERKHYKSTMIILVVLSFLSLYVNSLLATPIYKNGVLQSVDFVPNYFLTYQNPFGLKLTEKWQWILYILILTLLAFVVVGLMYIPVFKRNPKKLKKINN